MAKIGRLTENNISRLVKKIIKEEDMEHHYKGGGSNFQVIENAPKKAVDRFLENLPENTRFIIINNCQYADFSNIDICNFEELKFVNLKGTENNFEEQNYDCDFTSFGDGMFDFG